MNKLLFSISGTVILLNCTIQLSLAAPPSNPASVQRTLVKVKKTKVSGKTVSTASAAPLVDCNKLQQLDASYKVSDRASKAMQQGNWTQAKLLYQQAQAMWPTNDAAYYGLGQCAAHDGDLATAIADYRHNVYWQPNPYTVSVDGYLTKDDERLLEFALLLSQAGLAGEATIIYNRGIGFCNYEDGEQHDPVLFPEFGTGPDQIPYNASLLQAMAHAALSTTALHFDDVAALSHVQQSAALAPDNAIVQFYLGDCLRCAAYYPSGTSFSADTVVRNRMLAKAAFVKAAQSGNGQILAAIKERQY